MSNSEQPRHEIAPAAAPLARPVAGNGLQIPDPFDLGDGDNDARAGRAFSFGAIWRFKWTVVLVTLLVAPVAVVSVWLKITPKYEARALVHVRSKLHHLVEDSQSSGSIPIRQYDRYLASQAEIIKSNAIRERLRDRQDIRATTWFRESRTFMDRLLDRPADPFDRLSDELVAKPGRSELIEISLTTGNAAESALLVNAVVEEYVDFVNEQFTDEDRMLLDELREDERNLSSAIAFSEKAASDARRRLGTGASPDALISQQRVRLDEMQGELARLDLQIRIKRKQLEELQGDTERADAVVTYHEDAEWRRLKEELDIAEKNLADAADQFQSRHPTRVRLESEVEFARDRLARREKQLDDLAAAGVPIRPTGSETDEGSSVLSAAGLKSQLHQMELQQKLLQETVDRLQEQYAGDFEAAETLRAEGRKSEELTERLRQVEQRERELLEKGRVPPSIKVMASASRPARASNAGKRIKLSGAAVFGALLMGLACAYLRYLWDPKVAEPADVQRALHGPFLGYLPLTSQRDAVPTDPDGPQAEAIRMVRTALITRLDGQGGKIIQITSSDQASGKSTLAILLARSLAQLGSRVLLVDADLRRPSLHRHFQLADQPGLVGVLRNGGDQTGAISATETAMLDILPAGRRQNGSDLEFLANGHFSALLTQWRSKYDFTVLDGPPLIGTADAAILSRQADGTILAVREGHCRRSSLAEGLAMLSVANANILGSVFIGSRRTADYYYGYQADDVVATARSSTRTDQ